MNDLKNQLKNTFNVKLQDLTEIIFQGFKTGVYNNKNTAIFTIENVKCSIKIETSPHPLDKKVEIRKFEEVYQEKLSKLKAQIFYAFDKEVFDNENYIRLNNEGNISSSISFKTSTQSKNESLLKEFLNSLSDDQCKKQEGEESNHMII